MALRTKMHRISSAGGPGIVHHRWDEVKCSPRRRKGPRTRLVRWPGSLWNIERREIEGETQLATNKRERWRSILHSMVRAWWNGGEVIWKNIVWKVWLAASSPARIPIKLGGLLNLHCPKPPADRTCIESCSSKQQLCAVCVL